MQTSEIIAGIQQTRSIEDLRLLSEVLREQWKRVQLVACQTAQEEFHRGSPVKFFARKRGRTVYGTVTKVCVKNVQVQEHGSGNTLWTVNPTVLQKASNEEIEAAKAR